MAPQYQDRSVLSMVSKAGSSISTKLSLGLQMESLQLHVQVNSITLYILSLVPRPYSQFFSVAYSKVGRNKKGGGGEEGGWGRCYYMLLPEDVWMYLRAALQPSVVQTKNDNTPLHWATFNTWSSSKHLTVFRTLKDGAT